MRLVGDLFEPTCLQIKIDDFSGPLPVEAVGLARGNDAALASPDSPVAAFPSRSVPLGREDIAEKWYCNLHIRVVMFGGFALR